MSGETSEEMKAKCMKQKFSKVPGSVRVPFGGRGTEEEKEYLWDYDFIKVRGIILLLFLREVVDWLV